MIDLLVIVVLVMLWAGDNAEQDRLQRSQR